MNPRCRSPQQRARKNKDEKLRVLGMGGGHLASVLGMVRIEFEADWGTWERAPRLPIPPFGVNSAGAYPPLTISLLRSADLIASICQEHAIQGINYFVTHENIKIIKYTPLKVKRLKLSKESAGIINRLDLTARTRYAVSTMRV